MGENIAYNPGSALWGNQRSAFAWATTPVTPPHPSCPRPRDYRRISFLGPFWGLQPQFVDPHHLEWLIRRLSASSIWARICFFGERLVRSWRRVLWFRRAPPGPSRRAFARGWVGSRYRAEKRMGGGVLYYYVSVYLEAHLLPRNPLVDRALTSHQDDGKFSKNSLCP